MSRATELKRLVVKPAPWLAAAALLVFGALPVVVTAAAAGQDDFALELDHGHIDVFTVTWHADQLALQLQEDVTGHHVLHDPSDVLLKVKEEALITLPTPAPAHLTFLGDGGEQVYFLPQTQDPDLIWPGWSTERLSASDITGQVHIDIESVDGPGDAFLWQTGTFGDSVPVLTSGDYQLPGTIAADVNAHVHANWAFTEPGRYTLKVRASGTHPGDTRQTPVESPSAIYTFDVGDGGTPDPDPTPDPTPTPTPTPTPSPEPTPNPTPDPTPDPEPDPEPGGDWNVANGHVNKARATVLNSGHIDIASLLRDGDLVTLIKDTTASSTPVWRDPAKTVLQVLPSSKVTVPANPAYSFLGSAGEPVYQVTQIQQPGLLWPGWSTESIPVPATTGGVRWTLSDMSGPGEFSIYETDPFGQPTVLFNTRNGITADDRFTIPKNTHAHGSWAFSAEGTYCLAMQRVAQLSGGTTVSDQFVLAVAVGTAGVTNLDPAQCGQEVDVDPPSVAPPAPDHDEPHDDAVPPDRGGGRKSAQDRCSPTAPPGSAAVLSAGHIDYSSRIIDGRLVSQIGDDTQGSKIYREPDDTILWLKPAAEVALPAGYGQVGPPGSVVWQVPQTQNPALIWLGWSTELLNAGNVRGKLDWTLDRVEGPGAVNVYLSGSFGGVQNVVFSGGGSSYTVDLGVHAHANWAFSEQGIYRLTTTQSVTLADGERSSDTEVLTIAVGDVDPTSATSGSDGCQITAQSPGEDPTAVAAAQVFAPIADTSIAALPETDTATSPVQATALADDVQTVQLLLGVLGGLLLLGAGGIGALWWRAVRQLAVPGVSGWAPS